MNSCTDNFHVQLITFIYGMKSKTWRYFSFFHLSFLSRKLLIHRTTEVGKRLSLFLSFTSTHSRTFRHLFDRYLRLIFFLLYRLWLLPVDTGRKLNVHKTFRRLPGRLLKALCTFNLRPVSTGLWCFLMRYIHLSDWSFVWMSIASYYSNLWHI